MNFISKLFKKKEEETEVVSKGSVEEFVTLIRVYYQAVMAVQLGITNLNILNDMALFKRMLKIPTQNNKLGIAEKSRSRKILMQEYGLNENFFKEIDTSVKKHCRTQNDVQGYLFMYQGFSNDLMMLMGKLQDAERHQILFHHVSGIQQRPVLPARQPDAMEIPLLHASEETVIFADTKDHP